MLIIISIILSIFYILFFSFFRPEVKKEYINSWIKDVWIFNILQSIMIYFYISIIVFYSAYLLNFWIIWYSLLFISLFFIFFINIKIHHIFKNNKINITTYKYIKNENNIIIKNIFILSAIYSILFITTYLFNYFINNDLFINAIHLLIIPFIWILFFSDKKYNLINDIIAIPFFMVFTYYIFFISNNISILPFSYFMLWTTLWIITLTEFILSKIKNTEITIMWFSDPYILYMILLIMPFHFIIIFIFWYIITTIYAKYNKINEAPLFWNIVYIYIIYIIAYLLI